MNNQEAIKIVDSCRTCNEYCESKCNDCSKCDEAIGMAIKALEEQDKHRWIPVSERLPEEHNSMFAKFKGTDKWDNAMFEKISDDVVTTVEFNDGTRKTMTMHTTDGQWKSDFSIIGKKVIAWTPLIDPYKGE